MVQTVEEWQDKDEIDGLHRHEFPTREAGREIRASEGPHLDGTVVYQARTLLRMITHDYTPYTNDCETHGNGGNARKILAGATEQEYYLSPNPNDGNVQLWQNIEDRSPVSVAVYNVLGASVYKSSKYFDDKTADLNLTALAPGMYYILLQDNASTTYTLRFVKK